MGNEQYMTLKSIIKDGRGTGNLAGVSTAGELVIRGLGDNQSNNQILHIGNQAYNFFPPLADQTFVITTIIISAKDNTTITIFSAPSAASATIDTLLFTTFIHPAATMVVILPFGGFLSVGEGEYLNAATNKPDSPMTIIGFYRQL